MRKLPLTFVTLTLALAAQSSHTSLSTGFSSRAAESSRGANSLCTSSEDVIFNCEIAGRRKIVSLCSSRELNRQQGYLQYRFGRAGAVELEYPRERENTQTAFKYSRYTRPLVTLLTVSFESGGYTYEIHDDDNSEGRPTHRDFYLTVTPAGANQNPTEMRCTKPVTSHLIKLEDVVPNEEAP